jgi:divalent metal cation (Fe/Co/Zn/Cd) transporter
VGVYLLFDGGMKLVMREHPTIGGLSLLGHVVWTGWLAIAVLVWSGLPAHFLGRAKRKCAEVLHDKTLSADADINAADWQSAAAAVIGIIGVSFGLWWADSAAAALISLEIMRSGWVELRTALGDIMDRRPMTLDQKKDDPVTDRVTEVLRRLPWIDDVIVRIRERGRELTAEAHVVPKSAQVWVEDVSKAGEEACRVDPRLADVTIAPVSAFPDDVAKARQQEPV